MEGFFDAHTRQAGVGLAFMPTLSKLVWGWLPSRVTVLLKLVWGTSFMPTLSKLVGGWLPSRVAVLLKLVWGTSFMPTLSKLVWGRLPSRVAVLLKLVWGTSFMPTLSKLVWGWLPSRVTVLAKRLLHQLRPAGPWSKANRPIHHGLPIVGRRNAALTEAQRALRAMRVVSAIHA